MRQVGLALLASAALLALSPSARAVSFDDGEAAFLADRYDTARAVWSLLASQGNPRAADAMGMLYDLGAGVAASPPAALAWYRTAAQDGLASAEFNVGVMLDSGQTAPPDRRTAAVFYARAAARGHARAAYDLAQLYGIGQGVPLNPDMARAWYEVASRDGLSAAAQKLAASRVSVSALKAAASATPGAEPAYPEAGAVVHAPGDLNNIVLVWTAPASAESPQFFLDVRHLDGGAFTPLFEGYTNLSALAVDIGATSGQYAWRVLAVAPAGRQYVASAWTRFAVTRTAAPFAGP